MSNTISPKKNVQVYLKTDGHCAYCGESLEDTKWHVEHMMPKSRGGDSDLSNLLPACEKCNLRKHARTVAEFREYIFHSIIGDIFSWVERLNFYAKNSLEEDESQRIEDTANAFIDAVRSTHPGFYFEQAQQRGGNGEETES